MSGVSSRVMNMKFMRKANKKENIQAKIPETPKEKEALKFKTAIEAESHWELPIKKQIVLIEDTGFQKIGYSQMKDFMDSESEEEEAEFVGRRVFGKPQLEPELTESRLVKESSKPQISADELLTNIMDETNEAADTKEETGVIPSVENFLNEGKKRQIDFIGGNKSNKKRKRKQKK